MNNKKKAAVVKLQDKNGKNQVESAHIISSKFKKRKPEISPIIPTQKTTPQKQKPPPTKQIQISNSSQKKNAQQSQQKIQQDQLKISQRQNQSIQQLIQCPCGLQIEGPFHFILHIQKYHADQTLQEILEDKIQKQIHQTIQNQGSQINKQVVSVDDSKCGSVREREMSQLGTSLCVGYQECKRQEYGDDRCKINYQENFVKQIHSIACRYGQQIEHQIQMEAEITNERSCSKMAQQFRNEVGKNIYNLMLIDILFRYMRAYFEYVYKEGVWENYGPSIIVQECNMMIIKYQALNRNLLLNLCLRKEDLIHLLIILGDWMMLKEWTNVRMVKRDEHKQFRNKAKRQVKVTKDDYDMNNLNGSIIQQNKQLNCVLDYDSAPVYPNKWQNNK